MPATMITGYTRTSVVLGGRLDDGLDLYGEAERQSGDPDCGSGLPTDAVAEGTDQEIGCAVCDEVLFGVVRSGVDLDHHFHEAGDSGQVAQLGFHCG
jgi:hypothetical protein